MPGIVRVFFATDIHGSETCWRKFLNSGTHYEADVMILGGDMTGKALVPIIHDGGGRWHATLLENRSELSTEDEVLAIARQGAALGCKEALFTLGEAPEASLLVGTVEDAERIRVPDAERVARASAGLT